MTFFLQDQQQQISVPARGTDTPPTSFWGGISAAYQKEQIESNANFYRNRVGHETAEPLARRALEIMDDAPIKQYYAELGIEQEITPEIRDAFLKSSMDRVLTAAREDQKARPEDYNFDISEEAIENLTNARLQKEHQDLTETLDATGGGVSTALAEIAGGIGGASADIRNIPFLIAGGGTGSIARVMGREAMLNVAAEGVTMPDRFDMAKRLDIPEPDVAMSLAYAAAGGALIGGAVEGLARGITYWRGTRTGRGDPAVPRYDQEANADIAEDALTQLQRPFDRVREAIIEPRRSVDTRQRQPAPSSAVDIQPIRVSDEIVAAPAAQQGDIFDLPDTWGSVGERQTDIEDLISESRARDANPSPAPTETIQIEDPLPQAVERRLTRDAGGSKPLTDHVKRRYGGIQPGSRLAEELKARGITSKTAPGLFRKSGRSGFDNIPASEEPHLAGVLGEDGNGYLNEQAIADAIAAEAGGTPTHVTREQADYRAELDARREWQDRLDRRAAAAAGKELDDELFQMPEAPAWVDVPAERQAIADYQTDDLRTHIEQAGDIFIGDRSASSLLDELDADDEFADVIALCGRRATA